MLPKAIIFDLDDTLIAFTSLAGPIWRDVCEEHAAALETVTSDELYTAICNRNNWYWSDPQRHQIGRNDLENTRRRLVSQALGDIGLTDTIAANSIADSFFQQREESIHLLPGAIHVLTELRRRNVTLALVTNGQAQSQRGKIERFDLARFFEVILIEGELGFGKPEPAIYRRALDELAMTAGDVWFIGDNLVWDVAAPQEQGIYSIWYDYKNVGLPSLPPVAPDRIINTLNQLIE